LKIGGFERKIWKATFLISIKAPFVCSKWQMRLPYIKPQGQDLARLPQPSSRHQIEHGFFGVQAVIGFVKDNWL